MSRTLEHALEIAKDPSHQLGVTVGNRKVEPGGFIPKAGALTLDNTNALRSLSELTDQPETHEIPKLSFSNTGECKYIALCIDLDAPFAMLPFLSPICHWLQTDLDRGLATATPPVIPYRGAGPPPIARAPHRYVFMLFKQPEAFDKQKLTCARPEGEAFPMTGRMRFDVEGLLKGAGLDEMVAANWFTAL